MASTIITAGQIYGGIGLVIALLFIARPIEDIDASAKGSWAFRPLLVPAFILIWPLILWRWLALRRGYDEARRHRPPRRAQAWVAILLSIAIPVIIMTGLVVRQNGPFEQGAVQIEAPDGDAAEEAADDSEQTEETSP